MRVVVVPHDASWAETFEREAVLVRAALGDNTVQVHHIGSTAIAGIYAKPVIDLLVEVRAIEEVDARRSAMEALRYEALGEFGIVGRRYFRKENDAGLRTHHVHAFARRSAEVERHLAFRDYLRTHGERAKEYSELKRALAAEYPNDIEGYMDGKDAFIKAVEREALAWRASQYGPAEAGSGPSNEESR